MGTRRNGGSNDCQWVAFRSAASDLVPGDINSMDDIFLFDRSTGRCTLVSRSLDGSWPANGMSQGLFLTPDGQRVVFASAASDLVAGDLNGVPDVFVATIPQTIPTDTDQDGLDDGWELAWFGSLAHDGTVDADGDGASDAVEYRAGTNPLDATSAFSTLAVAFAKLQNTFDAFVTQQKAA